MPKNPQFEQKIHQNILRPLVDRTSSPTHGVILFFDQVTNTATVMLSGQGSDEAAETISKVPCPCYSGVQSVAPEAGRPCLVIFKDNNRAYPYISHYFNNDYGNIDYLRSYKATTSTPHYMFTF